MRTALILMLAACLPCAVLAQETAAQNAPLAKQPVGPYVADVRVAFPKLPNSDAIATGIGVATGNLPTRALGLVAGVHVYPLRGRKVTLGIGGEVLVSGRSRTQEPAAEGQPEGPTVNARFSAITPQVSLNFGAKDGWSYLSAGLGWARYTAERQDMPLTGSAPRATAFNYGGGARWFATKHLAVSLDLRFHRVNATTASGGWPAVPAFSSMVISGGLGLR